MTARDIGFLSIRIVAIFVLIIGLRFMPNYFSQFLIYTNQQFYEDLLSDPKVVAVLATSWVFPILIFLISFLLWFKAEKLCDYFLRNKAEQAADSLKSTTFNVEEFQIISFSIIGLIVLVQTLPQLTSVLPKIILNFDPYRDYPKSFQLTNYALILSLILQIAIGAYLFFGSQGLIGLWRKLRSGTIRRFDDPTP